jgi:four helix bundle protein
MAARFEDLDVWKLAEELKEEVFAFTGKPPAAKDFEYRDQIRDSARSAPRNISEGFGRYYPSESVPFYRIALGSLTETLNHLIDGHKRSFLTDAEYTRLRRLNLRGVKALKRWIEYLEGPAAARFNRPRPKR